MRSKKLTDKERRFCLEYLIDSNATQAAIRAGYSKKTAKEIGHQNLTKLHIKEFIAERRDAVEEKLNNTFEETIKKANEIYHRCMKKEKFQPREALGAVDLIAKASGHYDRENDQQEKEPMRLHITTTRE